MNEDGAAMAADAPPENLVDLIGGLIEPPPPAPIPLTPQTWGWAALAILAICLIGWVVHRYAAHRRANAYRRAALDAVLRAQTSSDIAQIVRQAALTAYPRPDVANLVGTEWIAFLDRTGSDDFPAIAGKEMYLAPYRNEAAPPSPQLRKAAEGWLRTHRASERSQRGRTLKEADA
ncbi:MAG: DUF4381 domain-containing protein [Pseudomonadota bacterium]